MQTQNPLAAATLCATLTLSGVALGDVFDILEVGIAPDLQRFEGVVQGERIVIERNQDTDNTVRFAFAKTSRPCPPFCIQPMQLAPGVETIGELELIGYLEKMAEGDDGYLLIDSRTPDWVAQGTIPGAINIPWTQLHVAGGADPLSINALMTERFGARETAVDDRWDFSDAKTLVMFCNGMWCGQSPTNIKTLLKLGYPADKLKWYRGGMQNWENLGLSTARP